MKRRVKFIQEAQRLGEIVVVYVQSAFNRADILTKPVSQKIDDAIRDAILSTCGERRSIFTASWHGTCLSREAHIPGTSADEGFRLRADESLCLVLGTGYGWQTSVPALGFSFSA